MRLVKAKMSCKMRNMTAYTESRNKTMVNKVQRLLAAREDPKLCLKALLVSLVIASKHLTV